MTDMDTAWAVTAREPLEVVELEQRLDDEVLCEFVHGGTGDLPCSIIATHSLSTACPYEGAALKVCRIIVDWIVGYDGPCASCGRPVSVCWVVTEL